MRLNPEPGMGRHREARLLIASGFKLRWGASIMKAEGVSPFDAIHASRKPAQIVARNLMNGLPTLFGPLILGNGTAGLEHFPRSKNHINFALWDPARPGYVIPDGVRVLGARDFEADMWEASQPLSSEALEEALRNIEPISDEYLGIRTPVTLTEDWSYDVD